jgi:hypothetical protein
MKKAIPVGMAHFAPRTLSPVTAEALPASEGFAFNWATYFDGAHNRNPDGSDGGAGPHAEHTDSAEFFKALPHGAVDDGPSERSWHRWSLWHRSANHIGYDCNVRKIIHYAIACVRILMEIAPWCENAARRCAASHSGHSAFSTSVTIARLMPWMTHMTHFSYVSPGHHIPLFLIPGNSIESAS